MLEPLQLLMTFKPQVMFMRHVFMSLSFWPLLTLATPIHVTNDQTVNLFTGLNLTAPDRLFPSNVSIQDLDASSGRGLNIQCDGAKYGFNPSLSDCELARSYIAPDTEQMDFGERHTGLPESTFPLPYIIMGGK